MIKKILTLLICIQITCNIVAAKSLITDDFAEETLEHINTSVPHDFHKDIINDDLVDKVLKPKFNKVIPISIRNDVIVDNLAKKIHRTKIKPVHITTKYNFTRPVIAIQLKINHDLTTRNGLKEGDKIIFKTIKNIKLKNFSLPKGTEVIGQVETISPNDLMGTPEDLIIEDFTLKDHSDINLYGSIRKHGANRSWWLYPLYQAGNIAFGAAGYPFVLIRGGKVRLTTRDIYTVYYEY